MKITDAFLGEHGVFYAQFDHAEELLERHPALLEVQAVAALIAAALIPHAQLENDLLFAAVEHQVGRVGPLLAMRGEHDQIERTLEDAVRATSPASAIMSLRDAIGEARDHFRKEEQALFPLAESVLGEDRLNALGTAWAERRSVRVT